MAWRAYLSSISVTQGNKLALSVAYYDDADPQNSGVGGANPPVVALDNYTWEVDPIPAPSNASLAAEARRAGAIKRANRQARADLVAAVPIGTTITIP